MAKNILSGGVDFDDLFDPDIVGDGPSTAWLTSGGVALKYAALSYGTKRADVGYRSSAGVDVSNLWAAKGTAVYALPINGQHFEQSHAAFTSQQQVQATITFDLYTDGTYAVKGANYGQQLATIASGNWNTYGEPAGNFEALITISPVSGLAGDMTNTAAAWSPLSSGRYFSLSIGPFTGGNADERESTKSVNVKIRRASTGQVVSDTTFEMAVFTVGFA